MSEELKSHPDRSLEKHVRDVRDAASAILARHSSDAETKHIVEDIVSLHDLGKATKEFQRYIRDPAKFTGDRDRKAHTPIGFAATLLLGEKLGWPPFRILCVAAAVLGHHTSFPTTNRITDAYLMNARWAGIIEDQASGMPPDAASEVTGFDLREILANSADLCEDASNVADELVEVLEKVAKDNLSAAVADRLRAQFAFSVLLEADKAFLALSEEGKSRYRLRRDLALRAALVEEYLGDPEPSEINDLRTRARRQALEKLEANPNQRLWTLTLPTGLGKTLTAASLAFSLREALPPPKRRVFIVLPFLSIIDQTAKVYAELLGDPETSTLMQSHSLSERTYDAAEGRDAEFLLDTWDSEIVITTFDQFLLSLLGNRSRHQMRFHNLADAIVIFDEVQTLPAQMWDLLNHSVAQLTETLNSTAIVMSATQPGFIAEARELVDPPQTYYEKFKRYRLVLEHRDPTSLEDFIEEIKNRKGDLEKLRVLITLNTRASAREVRNALSEWIPTIHFLTADVTPKDRLAAIQKIKKSKDKPCLVVSTQVIEAGVDIDMNLVMRDFAPLDSLVQVAGRCNRNGRNPRCDVEVYSLVNDRGRPYAEMVYTVERGSPDVRLEITRQILDKHGSIPEEEILAVCNEYFSEIRVGKDLGRRHTVNWATLAEEQPDIRTLLRGERDRQVQLIVAERDEGDLVSDIEYALAVPDRWERRSALRGLAGRISRVTVSVWVKKDWHPGEVADPIGNYNPHEDFWKHPWWIVREGNYSPQTGLEIEGDPFI